MRLMGALIRVIEPIVYLASTNFAKPIHQSYFRLKRLYCLPTLKFLLFFEQDIIILKNEKLSWSWSFRLFLRCFLKIPRNDYPFFFFIGICRNHFKSHLLVGSY